MDNSEHPEINFSNPRDIRKLISSYARFIPHQMLDLLNRRSITDVSLGDQVERKITILFSDIRSFTTLSEQMSPQENFNFINSYFSQMEPLIGASDGIVDKFIGDAIMAVFPQNTEDAVNGALLMLKQLKRYNEGRRRAGYQPIRIGIGLNTGLSMVGTVGGYNRMESTVISDAVNLAARLETLTKTYGVPLLISEHTYNDLEDHSRYHIRFIDRIFIKGKKQAQSVYEVYDRDPPEEVEQKDRTKQLFEEALANYHLRKIREAQELLEECRTLNRQDRAVELYLNRCSIFQETGQMETTGELEQQLKWDSSFELNHATIDKQHHDLLDQSIKLFRAVDRNVKKEEIDKIMEFLGNYVTEHFRTEEELMEKTGYPFISHQKQQHRRFITSFHSLKKDIVEFQQSKTYLLFRIQILLIDWIVNHTLKEDKHFGRYLANINGG